MNGVFSRENLFMMIIQCIILSLFTILTISVLTIEKVVLNPVPYLLLIGLILLIIDAVVLIILKKIC